MLVVRARCVARGFANAPQFPAPQFPARQFPARQFPFCAPKTPAHSSPLPSHMRLSARLPIVLALCLATFSCGGGGGGGSSNTPPAPTGLGYNDRAPVLIACVAAVSNTPTVTGDVTAYSVEPALPPGLVLDPDTGILSGSPTALAVADTFTVTATGPGGSTTVDLVLEVIAPDAPANLVYPSAELTALVDVEIDAVPTFEGVPSTWSASPALPAGLVLDPLTGALSGSFDAPAAAATFTITAEDCLGRLATLDIDLVAIDTADLVIPRFVHTVADDGTLASFGVKPNGQLTTLGYDLVGTDPVDIAASWTRRHVLVATAGTPALESYRVDPITGRLGAQPVDTVALPAASGPRRILVDDVRRVAWVSLFNANAVAGFALEGDGGLTPLPGSPFALSGVGAFGLALSPDGDVLLVTAQTSNSVTLFELDGAGVPIGESLSNVGPNPGAIGTLQTVAGSFVYIAEDGIDAIGIYALQSGSLSQFDSFSLGVGSAPIGITTAVVGSTARLYATRNDPASNLLQFDVLVNGALSGPTATGAAGPEGDPRGFVLSLDRTRAYTLFGTVEELAGFTVDGAGVLSVVAPAESPTNRMRTRPGSVALALTHGQGAVVPVSDAVYTINRMAGDITQFAYDPVFASIDVLNPAMVASPLLPTSAVVHPQLDQLYVAQDAGGTEHLRRFALDAAGAATPIDTLDLEVPFFGLFSLDMDASGRFLFGSARGAFRVFSMAIAADGTATVADQGPTGELPLGIAAAPNGAFVYVANVLSNTISGFAVDPRTGALTEIAGSPFDTGESPFSVTVDPTGRWLYAPGRATDDVWAYTIHPETGALQAFGSIEHPFATGAQPELVAIDPGGRLMYVACAGDGSPELRAYRLNLVTENAVEDGALIALTTISMPGIPVHLEFDAGGTRLFVTLLDTGEVRLYEVNLLMGGNLTLLETEPTGAGSRFTTTRAR